MTDISVFSFFRFVQGSWFRVDIRIYPYIQNQFPFRKGISDLFRRVRKQNRIYDAVFSPAFFFGKPA
ncbi:hypothetical protein QUF72_16085, partial [Desulfobacterales bacterium HSG2]|nr:hypothetical protein [Desulfobacterales bacterium HSG2]